MADFDERFVVVGFRVEPADCVFVGFAAGFLGAFAAASAGGAGDGSTASVSFDRARRVFRVVDGSTPSAGETGVLSWGLSAAVLLNKVGEMFIGSLRLGSPPAGSVGSE